MDIKISEFPPLAVSPSSNAVVPIVQNNGNYTLGVSVSAIPNSLVVRGVEGGARFSSITGDGNSDTAALISQASNIGTGISGSSDNGLGINGQSQTGTGIYGYSPSGRGTYGVSSTGLGLEGSSNSGTGLSVNTNSGIYSAVFQYQGNTQMAISGDYAQLKWFNNSFTGNLIMADLSTNQNWTLPDKSGKFVLSDPITNNVRLDGNLRVGGLLQFANHGAADIQLFGEVGALYTLVGSRAVYAMPNPFS